jgi:sugar lactone lactonase YvrE
MIGKLDVGGHANGLSINRDGTLWLAAAHDGTVKVLGIEGKSVKLLDQVKVGEKRLSGISFHSRRQSGHCRAASTKTAPRF